MSTGVTDATMATPGVERDVDAPAKRRKLRKGTRSCLDCRRRKVKCIYTSSSSARCIVCERRGTQCISQYDSPAQDDAVDDDPCNAAGIRTSDGDDHTGLPSQHSFLTPQSVGTPNLKLPLSNTAGGNTTSAVPQALVPIIESLLRAIPCDRDIYILSNKLSVLTALQYESDYTFHGSWSDKAAKDPMPFRALLSPEKHPTLLARQMLLFAAAVQHLSPNEVVPGLNEHHHVIMKRMAESAIQLANMNDQLLGTLEALENLIFEMFYHVESSNIRRAWITTHRAVTAAQLLDIHRAGHRRFGRISEENNLDPDLMWTTIVSMERMLSLLLGLPSSTSNMLVAPQPSGNPPVVNNLTALVASLAGRILERNQVESAQRALDMTLEIDREIIIAADQMPTEFWRPLAFAGLESESFQALVEARRAFGHMCYYSMVVQLHLPHMLHPHDASRRLHSKIACVNASREVLTREIEMRTFNPTGACCRMSDFLALIAGMALMLGHITSHSGNESNSLMKHQRLGDRATVQRALDCITPMYNLHGDMLAVRCSALLQKLLAIEEDAARRYSLRASQSHEAEHNRSAQHDILIMRVPYLGSIQVSREGAAIVPAARMGQAHALEEGVTIGGIGSMVIEQSSPVDTTEDNRTVDDRPRQVIFTSAAQLDSSGHQQLASDISATTDTSETSSDPMFPDVASSFDDWVFQGVDTAFMETLMRGSAVPFSDDLGDETWDISTFP